MKVCFSKNHEVEAVISELLETMFKNHSLYDQFLEIISILTKLDWLDIDDCGGIYLMNKKQELVLVAHKGLEQDILYTSSRLKPDECYSDESVGEYSGDPKCFCNNEDIDSIIYIEGSKRSYYSIPLKVNQKSIGVMLIYVKRHHDVKSWEHIFVTLLSSVVSSIIGKRILDEKFKIHNFRTEYFQRELLHKLVEASEFRDNETGQHIKRVTEYAILIGKKMGLPHKDIEMLRLGIPLHDVGKISIPDSILLKPGKLTKEEYEEMKVHTLVGGELLDDNSSEYIINARDIALTHHEKWDGSGYPHGLKGKEIPLFGRICAIVDVFDALSCERPYKKPWPLERVLNFMKENSGKQFDPEILDIFLHSLDDVLKIKSLYNDKAEEDNFKFAEKIFDFEKENFVTWDDSLLTGNQQIDHDHRYLLRLMNNLYNSIRNNNDVTKVLIAIKDLNFYMKFHFRYEERLMKEIGYADFDNHITFHRLFEQKLRAFEEEVMDMPFLVGFEILEYLRDWLIDHIFNVDIQVFSDAQMLHKS